MRLTIPNYLILLTVACWPLAGCSSLPDRQPVPFELLKQARVSGMPEVRTLTFEAGDVVEMPLAFFSLPIERAKSLSHPLTMLAISGGGQRGAFGAGVLYGWSEKGDRPEFDVVTGVSIGALLSPFAFLGRAYDGQMKEALTTVADAAITKTPRIIRILKSRTSNADETSFLQFISRVVTDDMIAAIGQEQRKGRRLFVCTTHMDAQMAMVWDMGAIAAIGNEYAHTLFRKVLCASASIPVEFPPVYFDVEANGQHYDEMHADGGVMNQVFGAAILSHLAEKSGIKHSRLFVLRNEVQTPEWRAIKPGLTGIALRSTETLIKTQGIGDIYRTYLVAEANEIDFNLAIIPYDFILQSKTEFDDAYMLALFEVGRRFSKDGPAWMKFPPGFTPMSRSSTINQPDE